MMPGENLLKSTFPYKCEMFNLDLLNIIYQDVIILLNYMPLFIRYKQAAFCYEELILAQPTIPLYHLAYAEVCGLNIASRANKE
jgi:hypothetical protein